MAKFNRETALKRAKEYGFEEEVLMAMRHGLTPGEALQDWDIYPYD